MNEIIALTGLSVLVFNSLWEAGKILKQNFRRKSIRLSRPVE